MILLGLLLAPINDTQIPRAWGFAHFDKVAHFGLFFITGLVSVFGVSFRNRFKYRLLFGTIFGLLLAVATEYGQSLLPSRDVSIYDFLADVIGLGVGLLLYVLLYTKYAVRTLLKL
jgi:VanZ family protein